MSGLSDGVWSTSAEAHQGESSQTAQMADDGACERTLWLDQPKGLLARRPSHIDESNVLSPSTRKEKAVWSIIMPKSAPYQ